MASRSIDDLRHDVRDKAVQHKLLCAQAGIDLLIYCTYRSDAEQEHLYAIGRTVKGEGASAKLPMGRKVTNARSGQSKHNHSEAGKPAALAYDCVPLVAGKPAWGNVKLYARVGEIGEQCGLKWAGRWKGDMRESPHFEV